MLSDVTTVPTLLVTGCNGQLGFALQRRLANVGRVVARDRAACDLSKPDVLRKTLREIRPDVILNAAGYTDVDHAERDAAQAFAVNGAAPGMLAEEARALGSLLVHYSTDYVFDGRKPAPYVETDTPNPLSVYGRSKHAGEVAIAESGARALVLRTGWLAGVHGTNFAKTILRLGREQASLRVIADRIGTPTTAELVADVTADLVERYWRTRDREAFPVGLYHLAATGQASWHAYAVEVLAYAAAHGERLQVSPEQVVPVAASDYPQVAPRPANACLDTTKLQQTFGIRLPDWRVGIHRLLDQILRP